jgi:arsenate reductase
MEKITVYEKPTCTTCRKVAKALIDNGVDFEKVNYYIEPFTENKLRELVKKMGIKPAELLRKKEKAAKGIDVEKLSDDQIIKLMIDNPDLVQRPIVQKGNKAILARPAERINELF